MGQCRGWFKNSGRFIAAFQRTLDAIVSFMRPSSSSYPRRIVCLSDESAELIYLLGEQDRIVGVSGFSARPKAVRSKPRVSTFRDADFEAIASLEPDLLITYSDVQAEIAREASLRGLTARDRVVSWQAVIERNPDVIFASWCGMKVNWNEVLARPGSDQIAAIRTGQIHEIPSSLILQPGPAALTDGVRMLHEILAKAAHPGRSQLPD
jgi:ABC-type Fe3+-hydroxamate transport system substrate-binding protein